MPTNHATLSEAAPIQAAVSAFPTASSGVPTPPLPMEMVARVAQLASADTYLAMAQASRAVRQDLLLCCNLRPALQELKEPWQHFPAGSPQAEARWALQSMRSSAMLGRRADAGAASYGLLAKLPPLPCAATWARPKVELLGQSLVRFAEVGHGADTLTRAAALNLGSRPLRWQEFLLPVACGRLDLSRNGRWAAFAATVEPGVRRVLLYDLFAAQGPSLVLDEAVRGSLNFVQSGERMVGLEVEAEAFRINSVTLVGAAPELTSHSVPRAPRPAAGGTPSRLSPRGLWAVKPTAEQTNFILVNDPRQSVPVHHPLYTSAPELVWAADERSVVLLWPQQKRAPALQAYLDRDGANIAYAVPPPGPTSAIVAVDLAGTMLCQTTGPAHTSWQIFTARGAPASPPYVREGAAGTTRALLGGSRALLNFTAAANETNAILLDFAQAPPHWVSLPSNYEFVASAGWDLTARWLLGFARDQGAPDVEHALPAVLLQPTDVQQPAWTSRMGPGGNALNSARIHPTAAMLMCTWKNGEVTFEAIAAQP